MNDIFVAPLELKFADGAPEGVFSGYGAVFGNVDAHGDVIMPGAFADSIAERKAQGRAVPMHLMHRVYGGDGLPVGVWSDLSEDGKGLKVTGKISGMNTDAGRLLFERVKDGALGGLSIGYKVRPNGSVIGKKAGEPKRTLKSLDLREISLVDDPSNALARVGEMKRLGIKAIGDAGDGEPSLFVADVEEAIEAIAAAIVMQDKVMQSYYGGSSAKDSALLMDRLRDGYEALTGERAPDGLDGWSKSAATIREIERMLREEFKLSRAEASEIAARRFTTQRTSGEGSDQANSAAAFMTALLSK